MGNKFVLNLVGSRASFEDDFELDSDFFGGDGSVLSAGVIELEARHSILSVSVLCIMT